MKFIKSISKVNTSIRARLILISFFLLTIPILILGIIGYQKSKTALDEQGEIRLKNSVEMTVEMIELLNEQVERGSITLENAQERVKQSILGEKDAEGNRPVNEKIDLGENGYIFILEEEGTQIAHPNIEGQNVWEQQDNSGNFFVQEMIETAKSGGGFTYYDWSLPQNENVLEPKVTYVQLDPHWNWIISGSTYMMDFNKSAKSILNSIFVIVLVTLIVGMAIIWIFSTRITKPIIKVTDYMDVVSSGDLTGEPLEIKTNDETGRLSRALNFMNDELRGLIKNVLQASQTMTSRSEELNQAAFEVSQGSEQVATTMQELAAGAESQAHNATDLSTTMIDFIDRVREVDERGQDIQSTSDNVLELTNDGNALMEQSTKQMSTIDNIVNEAVEKVEGLDRHTREISELVSIIHDIAAQTNLLALNAAIEAARAGEHGQGFAVVADEVGKLAAESAESVTSITEIVNRIQAESTNVVKSLQSGYKEVEEGTKQIVSTGETFEQISRSVTDMIENIASVSQNLTQIVKDCEDMNTSIEDIAAISEESAAGVEETTANSEQTSAAMQEVSSSSNELSTLAEQLNGLITRFKI